MAAIIKMENHRRSAQSDAPPADVKLKVAVGKGDLGRVTNKELLWSKIVDAMCTPKHVDVKMKQYKAWGEQGDEGSKKKLALKKSAGYVFGGWCVDGVRKKANVEHHSFVMLDMDSLTEDTFFDFAEIGIERLDGILHVWHTTIGHTPEKPRMRIAVPLSRTVNEQEFQAVSRLLARDLDPTMKQVDPVSFRLAQMMFRPVVTKDGEFRSGQGGGVPFDVDALLDSQIFDWKDIALLPRAPKEKKEDLARQQKGTKATDPTTKPGIVGDFCRMWDVPAAMAEFIPEVYDEADNGRYTYAAGHGHSGAVVYDDGKFLYSNHGSDPCSDQNVNAFDLVRIHLFGKLDKGADETDAEPKYESPSQRPSYQALVNHLADNYPQFALARAKNRYLSDDEVDASMGDSGPDTDDEATPVTDEESSTLGEEKYDDLGNLIEDKVVKAGADRHWLDRLDVTAEGVIKNTMANITKILQFHPRYAGCIAYNEFTNETYTRKQPTLVSPIEPGSWVIKDKLNGARWSEHMTTALMIDLSERSSKTKTTISGLGLKVAKVSLEDCIEDAGRKQPYHPVREYLRSTKWDGIKRGETLLIDYLGCEDTAYHRELSALMLLAAVVRAFEPGAKFDDMIIIEGLQGSRKSTFVETLGKNWAGSLHIDFDDNRKTINSMSGKWILEFGELKGMRGDRIEEMKHWMALPYDRARMAFGHYEEDFYRQSIPIGTTNEKNYLYDKTGNRRFYPVYSPKTKKDPIDIDAVREVIDQVWAEAVTWYDEIRRDHPYSPIPLMLKNETAQEQALEAQATRHVEESDPWAAIIEEFLEEPAPPAYVNGEWPRGHAEDADIALNAEDDNWIVRDLTCVREILMIALKIPKEKITSIQQEKVLRMLNRRKNWKYLGTLKRFKSAVGVQRIFVRIESKFDPEPPEDPAWDL